ncbi:MAG: suppressor of hpr1 [Geoglossum simile]|nr:MAG: suppressor of hpr1 [Geoglossum simile]
MDAWNPGETMDTVTQDARESCRQEPLYGGFTRFELEVEFVQCLGNPWYLNHLATQKLFDNPAFVAYLSYLQYFSQPEYTKYLMYPGPTLKALQLLQQEKFRQDILSPETVARMIEANLRAVAGVSTSTGNPSIHT